MEVFRCAVCDGLVFFGNSLCLTCDSTLGYDPASRRLLALSLDDAGVGYADVVEGTRFRPCANQHAARCNWLVADDDHEALCTSCRLTSMRPHDDDAEALAAFADAESAKRRMLYQLDALGLPVVDRTVDPERGLTFEFLAARERPVTTGHQGGVVTLDLSESDDAHREFVRQQLGEPYRTVLGHLRHEIAHYFWPTLVADRHLERFRELFGDERAPYPEALERHYRDGAPPGWETTHVSRYATVHPWEDWAETFAHYLHITAGLDTAASFGLAVGEPSLSAGLAAWGAPGPVAVDHLVGRWLAITFALNGMSRSIGQGDLYPFVLSPAVVAKLDFVHVAISDGRVRPGTVSAV